MERPDKALKSLRVGRVRRIRLFRRRRRRRNTSRTHPHLSRGKPEHGGGSVFFSFFFIAFIFKFLSEMSEMIDVSLFLASPPLKKNPSFSQDSSCRRVIPSGAALC